MADDDRGGAGAVVDVVDDDDDDDDENYAGQVTVHHHNLGRMTSAASSSADHDNSGAGSQTYDTSWSRKNRPAISPKSTPSRSRKALSTQQQQQQARLKTPPRPPRTATAASADEFSLPLEMSKGGDGTEEKSSSFKSWLTAGILDSLGTVAGVTLSTTGQLIAPPLQMTKSILLPALLALFIDTLDNITPPRVQDWFRVVSTSVYHLLKVLRSTPTGQTFSKQFVHVLHDIIQAFSSPESRQVIVDGMATSVKLADALNTPETKDLLEQISVLGCRIVDAAASGKTKQLMKDSKDLIWDGIETLSDPKTTLAIAEVTAHLCTVLEDTENNYVGTATSSRRPIRNTQNQSTYIDPITMMSKQSRWSAGITTEDVILNCLGMDNDNDYDGDDGNGDDARDDRENNINDDTRSVPSSVALLSLDPLPDQAAQNDGNNDNKSGGDWRERTETVNVELLKDKILSNKNQPRRTDGGKKPRVSPPRGGGPAGLPTSALTSAKSSVASNIIVIAPQTEVGGQPPREVLGKADGRIEKQVSALDDEEDLEDIHLEYIPRRLNIGQMGGGPGYQQQLQQQQKHPPTNQMSAVDQFYSTLDDLMAQKRIQKSAREQQQRNASRGMSFGITGNDNKSNEPNQKLLEATVKKWKSGTAANKRSRRAAQGQQQNKFPLKFQDLSRIQKGLVLFVTFLIGVVCMGFSGFAFYGMYTVWTNTYGGSTSSIISGGGFFTRKHSHGSSNINNNNASPEIVIRIVKEVVHVNPDGSTIDVSNSYNQQGAGVSQDEIQKVAECVQSSFQDSPADKNSNQGRKRRR